MRLMNFKDLKISLNKFFFVIILLSIAFINSETVVKPVLIILSSCCVSVYLIKNRGYVLGLNKQGKNVIFLVLLSGISLFFSGNIMEALVSYFLFFYCTLCSLILYDLCRKEPDKYFYIFFASHVIINGLVILFFKDYAFYDYQGETAIRGLYYEKNGFASLLLIGIPSFILNYKDTKGKNNLLFLFVSIWLIYLSESTTALILSPIVILLTLSKRDFQDYLIKIAPFIVLFTYGIYFSLHDIILNSSFNSWFYSKFQKNLNLSGRDVIWEYSLKMINKRPLLGYGFTGLWSNKDYVDSSSYTLGYTLGGGHAHSGYIELLLSVGLLGSFLLIKIMYDHYKRTKILNYKNKKNELFRVWFAYILMYAIISNSLMTSGILWSMLIIMVVDSYTEYKIKE